MSLNIFSASFVSRGTNTNTAKKHGKNAIAHAAYCRRETLIDERTGKVYDGLKMGKGEQAEWAGIFIPEKAPAWMRDPQKLWEAVEAREDLSRRKDTALLSRSWIVTFPKELDKQHREWMLKDFMRELTRDGWVVDAAIHAPDKDNGNFHAHLHLPMRYVDEDGLGYRRRLFDKEEGITMRGELKGWKERWSELGAKQLLRVGDRVEAERFRHGHLTNTEQAKLAKERGDAEWFIKKDREPGVHLGAAAWAMEQRGIKTRLGDKNRAVQERNRIKDRARGKEVKFPTKTMEPAVKMTKGVAGGLLRLAMDLAPILTPEQLKQGQRRQERDDLEAELSKQRDNRDLDRDR